MTDSKISNKITIISIITSGLVAVISTSGAIYSTYLTNHGLLQAKKEEMKITNIGKRWDHFEARCNKLSQINNELNSAIIESRTKAHTPKERLDVAGRMDVGISLSKSYMNDKMYKAYKEEFGKNYNNSEDHLDKIRNVAIFVSALIINELKQCDIRDSELSNYLDSEKNPVKIFSNL